MGLGESGVTPNIAMSCLTASALQAQWSGPALGVGLLALRLGQLCFPGRHPGTPGRSHLGGNPGWPDRHRCANALDVYRLVWQGSRRGADRAGTAYL